VLASAAEQCTQSKTFQRPPRARAKRGSSKNLDSIDDFRLPAIEDFHESDIEMTVESRLRGIFVPGQAAVKQDCSDE
jgi:hypothetical protein